MSSAATTTIDLEPLQTWFAELDRHQSELEQYLEDRFRELDALRVELDQLERELAEQTAALERSRLELEGQQRLAAERETAHREELARLQELYESAQNELSRMRDELAAAPPEGGRDLAADKSAAQLEVLQTQLEEAHNALSARHELVDGLQRERDELEAELDAVRTRAAELSDTLDQMKRESVEERAEWSAELKQMRRVLERQATLLASGASDSATTAAATTETQPVARKSNGADAPGPGDPVLGSVLAQFEKIRRERALRRKQPVEENV